MDDWIIETDGLLPANSDLAFSGRFDTFGNPIECCTIASPPMGETAKTDVFMGLLGGVLLAFVIWWIADWLDWRK